MTRKTPKITKADKAKGDSVLAEVMNDFTLARNYIKNNYQHVWDDCFKAYNGIRTRRGYAGVADDFIPEIFSIVESLKAAIAGSKPRFKFMPLDEEQEQDTTTLNALVDYYWSLNNMTEKVLNWVGDMIVYGNGVLMVGWDVNKPVIQHVPLSDFFVDPTATNLNRPEEPGYARYAGYRYLTSIEQLKAKKMFDVETGEMIPMYKNLDQIVAGDPSDDDDKTRKEQLIGSTLGKDAADNQVEVIEYYTAARKVIVVNRSVVIFDGENPFQREEEIVKTVVDIDGQQMPVERKIQAITGFLPFAILRNYTDSNLFYARGDVEVLMPIQEMLNDTSSQKRDNLAYALNNMWQIDPRFKHMAEQVESLPGAVFPIPRGALTPIEKNDISPAADAEIGRLTQAMRTASAADAAVQGVSQRFSRTTATEIAAQLNQASTRFTTKIQNLEDEGFAQLARILYKCIRIFVDRTIAVRIVGKTGSRWDDFDPRRYTGEYQPRVILDATAKAEAAEMAQAVQVLAQFGLNNPLVNQEALLRKIFESLLPDAPSDDIDALLTPPAPALVGADGQAVDPALVQSGAVTTPAGAEAIMQGGGSFGNTERGRATQSGNQGGGGSGVSGGNQPRMRANHTGTKLQNKLKV